MKRKFIVTEMAPLHNDVISMEKISPSSPKRDHRNMDNGDKGMQLRTKDCPDGSAVVYIRETEKHIVKGLQELRSHPHLCDVKFQVEGAELLAHKCVLALQGGYFQALFSEGFLEATKQCAVIKPPPEQVDRASAEALLDFMYTGQLKVTGDTVQGLITAADLWQMREVKKACLAYLEQHVDTHNCLGILMFAQQYNSDQLALRCLQLIKVRFPMVCQTEEFLHLPATTLAEILSCNDLTLGPDGEDEVLRALFRWIEFDSEHRLAELPSLLKTVRLKLTSPACRKELLDQNQLIQGNDKIQETLRPLLSEEKQRRRSQPSVYVIGGFYETRKKGPTSVHQCGVERLDTVTQKWSSCADLPPTHSLLAFAVHGRLFCCVKQPVEQPDKSRHVKVTETGIFEYRLLQNVWADAKSSFPPQALQRLEACLDNNGALAVCPRTNTIYLISHSEFYSIAVDLVDGDVHCGKVEKLSHPERFMAVMHQSHSAVVLDGKLYVLGGDYRAGKRDMPEPVKSVYMYDIQRQVWQARANMLEPRVKMAAAVLDGKIYACGGYNTKRLTSMECYDPATDTWTLVKPMNATRSHHQLIVLHGHLWAVGGKSYVVSDTGAWNVIRHCEVYDPRTDQWTPGPEMQGSRYGFAAAVI